MFKEEPMKTSNHCIRRLPLLLATTLGAAALQAHAGLYPPAAPPDSAFIRVFNDTAPGRLDAQLGNKKVPDARSEERRAGQQCCSTCQYRWQPYHSQNTRSSY